MHRSHAASTSGYGDLFRRREFRALWAGSALSTGGGGDGCDLCGAGCVAGAIAEFIPAGQAIAILSVSSVAVSLLLTPGLRRAAKTAEPLSLIAYATN